MRSMDEAHRQDYADKEKMRKLRQALEDFANDPPRRRIPPHAIDSIVELIDDLKAIEDHIVAVWD